MSIIKNPELYPLGLQKIEWVKRFMPVLNELKGVIPIKSR